MIMRRLKPCLQSALRRVGLYDRLKASFWYDLYWRITDRRILDQRDGEIEFYRTLLRGMRKGDVIFDIGANHGQKTDIFLRLGAKVVAVEPDEINQEVLKRKFLKCRIYRKPLDIVGKAVGATSSVEAMWIDEPGSAKNTLSPKWVETLRADRERFGRNLDFAERKLVETTTLENLIAAYGSPRFIKIDVEGYEPHVLRGLKQAVPILSFEVNLPEFLPEGRQCVELVARLSAEGRFNYAADCQRGLVLKQWLGEQEFLRVLDACKEKSIEVFWQTGAGSKERNELQSLDL